MKKLLIVYHTRGVKTTQLAEAVQRGAGAEPGVEVRLMRCAEAEPQDVLDSDALVLGTPENFGYMSGMMKDFLERIFYECEGKIEGLPWALLVSAGQDGTGAITSVERIVTGLRLKKVRDPILALKEVTPQVVTECEELGAALAAGLALGIY